MNPDPEIFLDVDDGVYSPSDDSFLLLAAIEIKRGDKVLEVGTGSGIIALHCAMAGARVCATDISEKAIVNARKNANANNLAIDFVRADLTLGLDEKFDVIIFNPPYLGTEDSSVLSAEGCGQLVGWRGEHNTIKRFLALASSSIKGGGRIYLVFSSEEGVRIVSWALAAYEMHMRGAKQMFYETLYVYELRKKEPGQSRIKK